GTGLADEEMLAAAVAQAALVVLIERVVLEGHDAGLGRARRSGTCKGQGQRRENSKCRQHQTLLRRSSWTDWKPLPRSGVELPFVAHPPVVSRKFWQFGVRRPRGTRRRVSNPHA